MRVKNIILLLTAAVHLLDFYCVGCAVLVGILLKYIAPEGKCELLLFLLITSAKIQKQFDWLIDVINQDIGDYLWWLWRIFHHITKF